MVICVLQEQLIGRDDVRGEYRREIICLGGFQHSMQSELNAYGGREMYLGS